MRFSFVRQQWMLPAILGATCALAAGCSSRPARVEQPLYAADAGAAAVAACDKNGDQALAGDELALIPGVLAALDLIDTNADGRVTAAELEARINEWRQSKTAEMNVPCRVTLDGEPLAGASVEFVPEPFLGPNLPLAAGTTGPDGTTGIFKAGSGAAQGRSAGVACGWYKVRIRSSEKSLPARYHEATVLGCEVAPNTHWVYEPGEVVFELTSAPSP